MTLPNPFFRGYRRPIGNRISMARPYGLLGLMLSLGVILLLTLILFAAPFGVAAGLDRAFHHGAETRAAIGALRADLNGERAESWQLPLFLAGAYLYAAMAAATIAVAAFRGKSSWRDLLALKAWRPQEAGLHFWGLVAAGIAYGTVASLALGAISPSTEDLSAFPHKGLGLVAAYALVAGAAPFAEELLFRGWIFTSLRTRLPFWSTNIASAAAFALAHWEHTHLYALAVFPLGLMLGAAREKTRSTYASGAFHAIYNCVALTFAMLGAP